MKKFFFTIVVMVCFLSQIDAQVRFGLKAGLNFDSFEDAQAKNSVGWQAGPLLQLVVPIIGIGVQPELLYVSKKYDDKGIGYFDIPINLRYELNLIVARPYFVAGPYFGFVVNVDKELESKIDKQKNGWGIGVGGGVEVWKLQVEMRYSWGLNDIGTLGTDLKTNTFSLSLGYLF